MCFVSALVPFSIVNNFWIWLFEIDFKLALKHSSHIYFVHQAHCRLTALIQWNQINRFIGLITSVTIIKSIKSNTLLSKRSKSIGWQKSNRRRRAKKIVYFNESSQITLWYFCPCLTVVIKLLFIFYWYSIYLNAIMIEN